MGGSYGPLTDLLRGEDYRVSSIVTAFDSRVLRRFDVLVVSGPRAEAPFSAEEVQAVHEWVKGGGSLLLTADHFPYSAPASVLAAPFGIEITDLSVYTTDNQTSFPFAELGGHEVTRGLESVWVFFGVAVDFPSSAVQLLPCDTTHEASPRGVPPGVSADGLTMAGVLEVGAGRVAVLGESGMISCQEMANGESYGFCAEGAEDNVLFTLQLFEWLAG